MILDSKGKLFGKISVIDAIIIILIALLLGGTYYKFKVLEKSASAVNTQKIVYNVEIKSVRNYILDGVKEGDTLFDKVSGNSIGQIIKVESKQAMDNIADLSGDYHYAEVENRYDVTVYVEADASKSAEGSYFVGRTYELISNSDKKFMTKYYEFTGSVRDIDIDMDEVLNGRENAEEQSE